VLVEEGGDAPVEDDGAGGAEDAFWVELQSDCRAFGGVGVAAMTTGPVVACEVPSGVRLVGISVVRQPREW